MTRLNNSVQIIEGNVESEAVSHPVVSRIEITKDIKYQYSNPYFLPSPTDIKTLLDAIVENGEFLKGEAGTCKFCHNREKNASTLAFITEPMDYDNTVHRKTHSTASLDTTCIRKDPEMLFHVTHSSVPMAWGHFSRSVTAPVSWATALSIKEDLFCSNPIYNSPQITWDATTMNSYNERRTIESAIPFTSGRNKLNYMIEPGKKLIYRIITKWSHKLDTNCVFRSLYYFAIVSFISARYLPLFTLTILICGGLMGFGDFFNRQFYISAVLASVIAWTIILMRLIVKCRSLRSGMFFIVWMYIISLLYTFHTEGVLGALKRIGIQMETQYPPGSPPV